MAADPLEDLERKADELVEDSLALFIRSAGELCERANRRVTATHLGNVVCLVTMGAIYWTVDGASACRVGMIFLGVTSVPVMVFEAVAWVRRRRR